jgi:DNA-directed RNA polymerase specialized sigma24 family protein
MGAPNVRKITEEQSQEIGELRERGWSYRRIGLKFGVSDGAVHYHCLKQGAYTPRTPGPQDVSGQPEIHASDGRTQRRFTAEEDAELQRLSLEGKKIREICEITGRAPTSVRIRLMTLAMHEEMEAV